jgi:hypothetical protein
MRGGDHTRLDLPSTQSYDLDRLDNKTGGVAVSWQLQEAKQKFSDLVLAAPVARRWIERTFGAILIGFAAKLAFTDR